MSIKDYEHICTIMGKHGLWTYMYIHLWVSRYHEPIQLWVRKDYELRSYTLMHELGI